MQIALYQPDIPQNVGSILRLCACMGVACHIIEPCGFVLDDKRLKRVAMDYADQLTPVRHVSWEAFCAYARAQHMRLILLTSKGETPYHAFSFGAQDMLLLGRESAGVPKAVADVADARLRIPLEGRARCLNVAQAASMALGEAIRQVRWK